MADPAPGPRHVRSVWPPILLFLASSGFVIWAQRYGEVPRFAPTVMGTATALLCLLDLASRFDTRLGRAIRAGLGADFRNLEMSHNPRPRDEAVQVLWMAGCVAAILLIGILPTVPLFIVAYMRLFGRRPWVQALLSGGIVLGFVVVVFEILLDYRLYRGVLFDAAGFSAW